MWCFLTHNSSIFMPKLLSSKMALCQQTITGCLLSANLCKAQQTAAAAPAFTCLTCLPKPYLVAVQFGWLRDVLLVGGEQQ